MTENNFPPMAPPPPPQASQPYPQPQQQPQPQKKGFAVTALVLGIVAILGSWIPFVSIGSALIGLVGLVFGIVAIIKASTGTAGGKVMAIIGTALSALAIVFAILSTAAGVNALDDTLDEVNAELTAAAVATSESDQQSSDDAESTDEASEPDGAADGSRENPFSAGSVLSNGEIEVVLGDADWSADDAVAAENQFNDVAPAGSTYVIVPTTITNVASSEPVSPWLELTVFYVAPDGRSFDGASAIAPNDLVDVDDLYEGGTATGNLVFIIPSDAQAGGVWGVEVGWFADATFVEAR